LVNSQVVSNHHIVNKKEGVVFQNVSQEELVDMDNRLGLSIESEEDTKEQEPDKIEAEFEVLTNSMVPPLDAYNTGGSMVN
jgi:hypothetical protein